MLQGTDHALVRCVVLDDPASMASLARELAANDWQVREAITAEGGAGAGTTDDRSVILLVDWPRRRVP